MLEALRVLIAIFVIAGCSSGPGPGNGGPADHECGRTIEGAPPDYLARCTLDKGVCYENAAMEQICAPCAEPLLCAVPTPIPMLGGSGMDAGSGVCTLRCSTDAECPKVSGHCDNDPNPPPSSRCTNGLCIFLDECVCAL